MSQKYTIRIVETRSVDIDVEADDQFAAMTEAFIEARDLSRDHWEFVSADAKFRVPLT